MLTAALTTASPVQAKTSSDVLGDFIRDREASTLKIICEQDTVGKIDNAKEKKFAYIGKNPAGKYELVMCDTGKAVVQTLVSPGKPHKDGGVYTPEGTYAIQ